MGGGWGTEVFAKQGQQVFGCVDGNSLHFPRLAVAVMRVGKAYAFAFLQLVIVTACGGKREASTPAFS